MQMLERYEESMVDLETLLKIDPNNSAAKKELQIVLKSKEDEVCIECVLCSVLVVDVVFRIAAFVTTQLLSRFMLMVVLKLPV